MVRNALQKVSRREPSGTTIGPTQILNQGDEALRRHFQRNSTDRSFLPITPLTLQLLIRCRSRQGQLLEHSTRQSMAEK